MKLNPKKCSFGIEEGKFLGYIVTSEGIRANLEKTKAIMDMPSPRTLKQMQSLSGKLATLNQATKAAFLEMKKLVSELPTLTTPKKGRETNYAPMEKLTLALVHAARRLRRYFQAHPIKVITDSPIGQVLNNSGASGRLAKWAVELGAYGITYVPRVVVKGENLTPGPRARRLYNDGASNNGGSEAGLILIAQDDVEYCYALRLNFSNSNNEAEYEALLAGLWIATKMQVKGIHAFEKVLELAGAFNRFRITHIPREENRKADTLSKLAAVQFDHLSKEVLVKVLNERSVEAQEKGVLLEDLADARILMEKIGNYTMEDGVLYRKSYLVPMIRCVGPLQANYIIREVHMGSCGMHDGPRQAHASVPRLPKADMISVTSAWPFMKCGMDIAGPLPEGPRRVWDPSYNHHRQWNSVFKDPFKKWVEKLKIQLISTSVDYPSGMKQ
ncbi:reverse transcriptase domain-containing protein [Tanacetum coccineum]